MRLVHFFIILSVFINWLCDQRPVVKDLNITIQQLQEKIIENEEILLLDVRTRGEFEGPLGHLPGSLLIPVQELEQRFIELNQYKEKEIVVICRSGNRSVSATKILISKGFNAVNVIGGMKAWNKSKETI